MKLTSSIQPELLISSMVLRRGEACLLGCRAAMFGGSDTNGEDGTGGVDASGIHGRLGCCRLVRLSCVRVSMDNAQSR